MVPIEICQTKGVDAELATDKTELVSVELENSNPLWVLLVPNAWLEKASWVLGDAFANFLH